MHPVSDEVIRDSVFYDYLNLQCVTLCGLSLLPDIDNFSPFVFGLGSLSFPRIILAVGKSVFSPYLFLASLNTWCFLSPRRLVKLYSAALIRP
jgi:hypothetical protein